MFLPILFSLPYIFIFPLFPLILFLPQANHPSTPPLATHAHSLPLELYSRNLWLFSSQFLKPFSLPAASLGLGTCLGLSHSEDIFLYLVTLNYCFVLAFQLQNSESQCFQILTYLLSCQALVNLASFYKICSLKSSQQLWGSNSSHLFLLSFSSSLWCLPLLSGFFKLLFCKCHACYPSFLLEHSFSLWVAAMSQPLKLGISWKISHKFQLSISPDEQVGGPYIRICLLDCENGKMHMKELCIKLESNR